MENIEQRVKKIVAEQLGVNEADVKNESSFVNDLGADSLDTVELVMALEEEFETEMYVYYVSNEYNFEPLENLPEFEPTHCRKCGKVIALADGGYSYSSEGYLCGRCSAETFTNLDD